MKTKKYQFTPSAWQLDPNSLDSNLSVVQYWKGTCMLTAQMKIEDARKLVSEGKAFVISIQAIGVIN